MKKITVIILSLGVLAGAYGFAFGVPDQISQIWTDAPAEDAEPPRGATSGPRGQSRSTTVVLQR